MRLSAKSAWTRLGPAIGLALAGCSFSYSEHRHYDPPQVVARPVVVEHVHSRSCGHCYDDGQWIVIEAHHHHGPGCGHEFNGHHWIVVRSNRPAPRPVPQRVVRVEHDHHDAHCGCVHDGRAWIQIDIGHVHGPGCGHVYIEGRWSIRRR